MSKGIVNVDYDSEADVLYLCIKPKLPSYAEEDEEGIMVRKSIETDEITGITILDFKEKYINRTLDKIALPIFIDFEALARTTL